jgi:hypothetical protein
LVLKVGSSTLLPQLPPVTQPCRNSPHREWPTALEVWGGGASENGLVHAVMAQSYLLLRGRYVESWTDFLTLIYTRRYRQDLIADLRFPTCVQLRARHRRWRPIHIRCHSVLGGGPYDNPDRSGSPGDAGVLPLLGIERLLGSGCAFVGILYIPSVVTPSNFIVA